MRHGKKIHCILQAMVSSMLLMAVILPTLYAQTQSLYEGYLYEQQVTIVTNKRCTPTSVMATDTLRKKLPLDSSEVKLSAEFCGYAHFNGKLVYTLPKSITAVLKDDSVLTFQSPAKANVSVSFTGTGNQTVLDDTVTTHDGITVAFSPLQGALIEKLLESCPNLSVSDGYWPTKTGPFSLSATAECPEIDFLLGYPFVYSANKDTLFSLISVSAGIFFDIGGALVPDMLMYEKATTKICAIIGLYKFVKKDSLETITVWQDVPFYTKASDFSSNKDNLRVEMDGVPAQIIEATPDSILVRVPADLVGDRTNIRVIPDTRPRDVVVVIYVKRNNTWVEGRRRMRFVPPRPLLYDEVTRANPPLVQGRFDQTGPRRRQAYMFLGSSNDGTVAVRLLNTSTRLAPLTLLGKVISPAKLPNYPFGELFDKNENPTYGNLLNIGNCNAAVQFPVSQDGWYIISVEAQLQGTTGGSYGPLPAMYQIHLAGNVGLPRKIINGENEVARAIRLDTYFNHPAPRTETLVNAGPGIGSFAETGLFKFANPTTAAPFAIAVLLPPGRSNSGFPFGIPPVRARGPARAGLFPNGRIDLSTPMAPAPGISDPEEGTVIDLAQVPIPASVEVPNMSAGVAAILGKGNGTNVTLPFQGFNTVIVDMGSGQEIVDAPGADLSVICSSGNYNIAVSQTPFDNTFVSLGSGSGTQNFDLTGSGLTGCRYVRITAPVSATIDAVHALNFLCDSHAAYGPISDVAYTTITMRRSKASANALDPMLELIAPDGSALGKNESSFGDDTSQDKSDAALISMDLIQSGFYRYLGRGYDTQPDGQSFGTYYTRLETAGFYDPVELAVSSESEKNTVAQKKGNITNTRQRDSYLFQAAPGTTIRIAVNGISTNALPDPLVELYDPEDFLIAANDDYPERGKRAAMQVKLPDNGRTEALPNPSTYRVVVMGIDGYSNTSVSSEGGKAFIRKVNGGQYELKVFTGAFETSTTVLQPQITSVSPAIFAAGALDQTLTIIGQNLTAEAVLSFSRTGIVVKSLQFISSTELRASVNINQNAVIGTYDVLVTVGAGLVATASNAVQVKASLGKIFLTWEAPSSSDMLAPPVGLNGSYGPGRSCVVKTVLAKRYRRADPAPPKSYITVDEEEPNNQISEAQSLPPDSVIFVNGYAEVADVGEEEIDLGDDLIDDIEDLYKIQITSPELLIVLGGFYLDCDLYLLDSDGYLVDYSIESGDSTYEFIELTDLPVGVYYLGVSIFDPDMWPEDGTPYELDIYSQMGHSLPSTIKYFHVYRSTTTGAKNNGTRIATVDVSATQYADPVLANGLYYYQVTAEYDGGESEPSNEVQSLATKVEQKSVSIVNSFTLEQNHPNPFNPVTTLSFSLPEKSFVQLVVFDVLGKQQAVLVETTMAAGEHCVQWSPGELPSGVYLARLLCKNQIRQIKMMYLK